jgi:hypothetical protein
MTIFEIFQAVKLGLYITFISPLHLSEKVLRYTNHSEQIRQKQNDKSQRKKSTQTVHSFPHSTRTFQARIGLISHLHTHRIS